MRRDPNAACAGSTGNLRLLATLCGLVGRGWGLVQPCVLGRADHVAGRSMQEHRAAVWRICCGLPRVRCDAIGSLVRTTPYSLEGYKSVLCKQTEANIDVCGEPCIRVQLNESPKSRANQTKLCRLDGTLFHTVWSGKVAVFQLCATPNSVA